MSEDWQIVLQLVGRGERVREDVVKKIKEKEKEVEVEKEKGREKEVVGRRVKMRGEDWERDIMDGLVLRMERTKRLIRVDLDVRVETV